MRDDGHRFKRALLNEMQRPPHPHHQIGERLAIRGRLGKPVGHFAPGQLRIPSRNFVPGEPFPIAEVQFGQIIERGAGGPDASGGLLGALQRADEDVFDGERAERGGLQETFARQRRVGAADEAALQRGLGVPYQIEAHSSNTNPSTSWLRAPQQSPLTPPRCRSK